MRFGSCVGLCRVLIRCVLLGFVRSRQSRFGELRFVDASYVMERYGMMWQLGYV